MGNCCTPYRVDFSRLLAVRGSKDQALLQAIRSLASEEGIDDEPETDEPGGLADADDPFAHIREAARAIVFGEPLPPEEAVTALGAILSSCAQKQGEFKISSPDSSFETLTALLRNNKLDDRLDLRALFMAGNPLTGFPLPAGVSAGFLDAAAVQRARAVLTKITPPAKLASVVKKIAKVIDEAAERQLDLYGVVGERGHAILAFVKLDRLRSLPGSRSRLALKRIDYWLNFGEEGDPEHFLVPDDEFEAFVAAEETRTSELDAVSAAAAIINGDRLRGGDDAPYYVEGLRMIVEQIGGMHLDNRAVAPAAPQHFTVVDAALAEHGLGDLISMQELVFGGAPFKMPTSDDFPAVGHMTPEEVIAAKSAIGGQEWTSASREVQATIALVDRWIAEAASRGEGLVCFYA